MVYAEFLRVRRSLTWSVGILAALTLLGIYFAHDTNITIQGTTNMIVGRPVGLSMLTPFGMLFGMIYASVIGTSLNRENATRDLSWTKPISRTMLALQFVLLDAVAITVAFASAMLAVLAVLLRIHMIPVLGPDFVSEALLAIGAALMWYALIQMLSFRFGSGARSIAGILWPIALVIVGLTHAPGTVGALAKLLDYINPLAYAGGFTDGGEPQRSQLIALPTEMRALCVWLFTAVFCTIAITLWPRKEA